MAGILIPRKGIKTIDDTLSTYRRGPGPQFNGFNRGPDRKLEDQKSKISPAKTKVRTLDEKRITRTLDEKLIIRTLGGKPKIRALGGKTNSNRIQPQINSGRNGGKLDSSRNLGQFYSFLHDNDSNVGRKQRKMQISSEKTNCTSLQSYLPLTLGQWNSRSFHSQEKMDFARTIKGDLLCLQEIWQRKKEVENLGEVIHITSRLHGRGGGTASIKSQQLKVQKLESFKINKDTEGIKLRINQNYFVWLINIYIYDGKWTKVQKLFGRVRKFIPESEWDKVIIIGDFNIHMDEQSSEKRALHSLCKQMNWKILTPDSKTSNTSIVDFIITGSLIEVVRSTTVPSPSDHKAVLWDIIVKPPKMAQLLKIPDRSLAEEWTNIAIKSKNTINTQTFLQKIRQMRGLTTPMTLLKKRKRNEDLFKILQTLDDPSNITEVTSKYWRSFWERVEEDRFSNHSRSAYSQLKCVLKYHLFEKRDGAVINSVLDDSGTRQDEQEKVEEQLLKTLREIQVDEKWGSIKKEAFPKLNRISLDEMKTIVQKLATGKAIAWDAISDTLFKGSHQQNNNTRLSETKPIAQHTIEKLRNVWRVNLDELLGPDDTWAARLIPLNKVFPHIPNRTQMRPIMVQSPIIKLIEARFLGKLQEYLVQKLNASQTGFVPTMGIQVNLNRALNRITRLTSVGNNAYGLFIDFSNAYNSVPHTRLFQKLRQKNILEEEEVKFLEQLYCRYTIKLGSKTLKVNKGVAQGSVISPALFNIYIEDLSEELKKHAMVDLQDILMYADDILILCMSTHQITQCIKIIEKWCVENGMSLNKNKSGIVVFAPRRATKVPLMKIEKTVKLNKNKKEKVIREWTPAQTLIDGIPICSKYKYLGTYLNCKLTCMPQIEYINKKTSHLYSKLYPYLSTASANARRDMFLTMVAPLYNAALILLHYEPSKYGKNEMLKTKRIAFKQFMMISKRTNTILVEDMLRMDLIQRADQEVLISNQKWEHRLKGEVCQRLYTKPIKNALRGVPNKWCELVNTMVKPCLKCNKKGVVTDRWHLKYYHNEELPHINKIWREEICFITENRSGVSKEDDKGNSRSFTRKEICQRVMPVITSNLQLYEQAINRIQMVI